MASGFSFGLVLLLCVWSPATSEPIPEGVHRMECHDRYFAIAVDDSFAGEDFRFEAADGTGVFPITEQYAAECGYTIIYPPVLGHVELRASYFSCHTDNKDDETFTFNFSLIVNQDGKEVTYDINKTCAPSLPWSPREITCNINYIEISVRSEVACPFRDTDDEDSVRPASGSATSDWQVMFQKEGQEQLKPMELSEARKQGYVFDLTDRRLVFRTPYGQPDIWSMEENGVPVEAVHAILFSRQSWVFLMVDFVAACTKYEGSHSDSGYMMWKTPEMLQLLVSGGNNTNISIGVNGELVGRPVAEERGYIVEKHNATVEIGIPYNTEGVHRKSVVVEDLREFYFFNFHVEETMVDEDRAEIRLRHHVILSSPPLLRPVFVDDKTVSEERMFTICLGDVPEDVELTAVELNGHRCTAPFTNTSGHTVTKVSHPNNTQVYMLKVPFDDPVVIHQFSKEDAAMKHMLDINYTLTVLPEHEPYYHLTSVMAQTDVSPPQFDAICSESGISFKLDHRPFGFLWYASVGSERLTPELAAEHGYIMSNGSQSLMLEVPLLTQGYEYKDITLRGFLGTFEMLLRDHETSEVLSSTVKTCPFNTTEMIMCSTNGRMTVVADLSLTIPSGGTPGRAHLLDKNCGPKAADTSRLLFTFPLNSCGSVIMLGKESLTYENEITYSKKNHGVSSAASNATAEKVTVRCTYPLAGLHRLFSVYRFESETVGVGQIVHTATSTAGSQTPTIKPATEQTSQATTMQMRTAKGYQPAFHPPARYIRVSAFGKFHGMKNGAKGPSKQGTQRSFIRNVWN